MPWIVTRQFKHDMRQTDIYKPKRVPRRVRHDIRGVGYSVLEWGPAESPPIVWLHGWGDCAATAQFVVDALDSGRRVVAPDFRGFGESRAEVASYWFPDYLADLDALLSIFSPDAPVTLIGHSMGANVAGLYAGTMPERVNAFVNIEGFGLANADPETAPERYREWIEAGRATPAFSEYADFTALARRLAKRSPAMGDDRAEFVARAWAVEEEGRVRLRADPRHRLPNPVLYRRAESEACWRRVSAPVLLVSGGNSPFARGDDVRLDASPMPFPDARAVTIPDVGHMLHFEAAEDVAAHIEAFLQARL